MARCKHEKGLEKLTGHVCAVIRALDEEMRRPASHERGKRIGKIVHSLQWANDSAMKFDLGWGWRKINNRKKRGAT